MGNFSLKVDFDVAVKFSKEESYNRLLAYLVENPRSRDPRAH